MKTLNWIRNQFHKRKNKNKITNKVNHTNKTNTRMKEIHHHHTETINKRDRNKIQKTGTSISIKS